MALHYMQTLPNFICDQSTERYISKKADHWSRRDRYVARLTYNGNGEVYQLTSLNGRAVKNMSMESLGGTLSKGDFASALLFLFAPSSQAQFQWNQHTTLRNRDCFVFTYSVDRAHSRLRITEGATGEIYQPAYHGVVYIDSETKSILRLTLESEGIPANFPIQATSHELDFDWAIIAGEKYLLPFDSDVRLTHGKEITRNVSRFDNYRKFAAESNITFH